MHTYVRIIQKFAAPFSDSVMQVAVASTVAEIIDSWLRLDKIIV
jgi:hypothetical protein